MSEKCIYCEVPEVGGNVKKWFAEMAGNNMGDTHVFLMYTRQDGWELIMSRKEDFECMSVNYCPKCGRKLGNRP